MVAGQMDEDPCITTYICLIMICECFLFSYPHADVPCRLLFICGMNYTERGNNRDKCVTFFLETLSCLILELMLSLYLN